MSLGDIAYCQCHPCWENDGDCDSDDECMDKNICGTNNCPEILGFESNVDCCYTPLLGDENFCQVEFPCGEQEGDCDTNDECQGSLLCGLKNCLAYNGSDCCYQIPIGDEDFCTVNLCAVDEGDCDSDDECQGNLMCGSNNCPSSLGFDCGVDCCSSTQLMSPNYPNSYPNNAYETWLLTASPGSTITIQFHSFDVRH